METKTKGKGKKKAQKLNVFNSFQESQVDKKHMKKLIKEHKQLTIN